MALPGLERSNPPWALDIKRPEVKEFIAHMAASLRLQETALRKLLKSAESQPAIIDAMAKPAEKAKLWYEYRPIFLTRAAHPRGHGILDGASPGAR